MKGDIIMAAAPATPALPPHGRPCRVGKAMGHLARLAAIALTLGLFPAPVAAQSPAANISAQDQGDLHPHNPDAVMRRLKVNGFIRRAADRGVPEAAVRAIVERLGGQEAAGSDMLRWLENWLDTVQQELTRRADPDGAFATATEEAVRRFRAGRLAEASRPFMDLFEREEAQYRQRQTRLLQGAIRYDELTLNPVAAVDKLRRLAALEGASGLELARWLFEKAGEYHQRGEAKNDNQALLVAIEAYRSTLLEVPRDRFPRQWAMAQNNLANALSTLGERETGTLRLEQAIAVYELALQERTRERGPRQWAGTQNNLGLALWALADREGGTALLERAVTAYQAALQEYTREQTPQDWATTQGNLGKALQRLGKLEGGTARLEQAAAAYQAALREYTRERTPRQWALAQNNLGDALWKLGEREGDATRLKAAVAAYELALLERTRERAPLDWAATQHNLGNALTALSEQDNRPEWLERAVAAYQATLLEFPRDRFPLQRAGAQSNLGEILMISGERASDAARLEQAIQHITEALTLFRETDHASHAAIVEKKLSKAQAALEKLRRKKQ